MPVSETAMGVFPIVPRIALPIEPGAPYLVFPRSTVLASAVACTYKPDTEFIAFSRAVARASALAADEISTAVRPAVIEPFVSNSKTTEVTPSLIVIVSPSVGAGALLNSIRPDAAVG